jgi:hypothetical protein
MYKKTMIISTIMYSYQLFCSEASTIVASTASTAENTTQQNSFPTGIMIGLLNLSSRLPSDVSSRLASYLAAQVEKDERLRREHEEFTAEIIELRAQLDRINSNIAQLVSLKSHREGYFSGREFRYFGITYRSLQTSLKAIEEKLCQHQWGWVNTDGLIGQPESAAVYADENMIAGSWIAFLGDAQMALKNIKETVSTSIGQDQDSIEQYQQKIVCLHEICTLLKVAALDKRIGADYRQLIDSKLFRPAPQSSVSIKKRAFAE